MVYAINTSNTGYSHNFNNQNAISRPQMRSSYYETHYPLYQCDWTGIRGSHTSRIALSSYREDTTNRLQVVYSFPETNLPYESDPNVPIDRSKIEGLDMHKIAEISVNFPVTKLQWDPSMSLGTSQTERLATASECLRIYELSGRPEGGNGPFRLVERVALSNSKTKNLNQLPPLTSFDWCVADPKQIITCSIDTTCTLWDLSKGVARTQLIAHDSEVFDVKFLYGDKNVFSSCSSDGSIRVFDLRSLEHSTIIYEPQIKSSASSVAPSPIAYNPSQSSSTSPGLKPTPLLRLATSNYNANHIAAVEAHGSRVIVLDLRYPGIPIRILSHHQAPINSIEWHPTKNWLLTGSDDCQAFVYDLSNLDIPRSSSKSDQSPAQDGKSMETNSTGGTSSASTHRSSRRSKTADLFDNSLTELPAYAYSEDSEINNVTWDVDGQWAGVVSGKGFQAIKIE
ncbi:unnamed protein product [Kuraishia capsulata CBS 1993]|uniref:Anaphase-promoting complex subunit 4 WD40 domain-containing protein n=1 Tax=Kuraishia capsulata CBS 1993 TaxID=1382522 RepID=W6MJD4_9ASCO|nr:uncharacterized protein KUCA_T00002044001 [Kuraishia capsulata CBS 1993]CDK26073.1 unnamed protein product [Kuraishia capsulata CBS 1993]